MMRGELAYSYHAAHGRVGQGGRERIEGLQLQRLNATLAAAKQASPYYRRTLATVESLSSLDELVQLPLMDSSALAAGHGRLLCLPASDVGRIVTLPTSGTTAAQKRVAFAPEDLAASIEYFAAGMRMLADEGDAIAVLFPSERSFSLGALICSAVKSIKARPLPVAHPLDFAAVAELCRREDVKAMVGFPQNVLAVTQCCRFEGAGIALSSVLLSADHVAAPLRTAIAAATGAEVFAHYGLTEAGYGLAVECPEHQGLHVRESDLIVEVVDPLSGDVAADGELGEVVVTTLNQRAMPMIRYRTGDLACIIPGQCRCGSALRRLGRLSARAGERLALQGVSFGMAELEERLFTLPGIVDFHAAAQPCETEGTPRAALALRIKLAVLPGCGTTGADALAALEQAEPFKGLIAQGALHVEAQVDEAYANRPYYPAKRTIVKATSGL